MAGASMRCGWHAPRAIESIPTAVCLERAPWPRGRAAGVPTQPGVAVRTILFDGEALVLSSALSQSKAKHGMTSVIGPRSHPRSDYLFHPRTEEDRRSR